MGYYIEVPNHKFKASQLVELYGAEIVDKPHWGGPEGLVCVIDNGPWEAAGFAFSEAEFKEFARGDGRPKIWVQMDRAKAEELSGYSR